MGKEIRGYKKERNGTEQGYERNFFPVIFHTSYTTAKTEFERAFVTFFHIEFHITKSSGLFVIAKQRYYLNSTENFTQ
jgi:hypothetical protein